jgi:hypothetical protein
MSPKYGKGRVVGVAPSVIEITGSVFVALLAFCPARPLRNVRIPCCAWVGYSFLKLLRMM